MLQAKEIFQSAAKKLSWKSYLYSFLFSTVMMPIPPVAFFVRGGYRRDEEFMDVYRDLGKIIVEYHLWCILVLVVFAIFCGCAVGLMRSSLQREHLISHLRLTQPELGEGELDQECEACLEKNKKFIRRYSLVYMLVGSLFSSLLVQGLYELHVLLGLSYLWVGLLFFWIGLFSIFFFGLFENYVFDVICTDYLAEREDTATAEGE